MLSAEDIFISYNGESNCNEIDGISVSLVPGQITAIVGPNGSGKSTLIRSLSRVLKPQRGSVVLNDEDLYREVSARASAQSISVAPQDTNVAFDFTARELVSMGRIPHHSGWALFAGESAADRDLVDNALSRAQITPEQAARPIMTLSGGERQRVLIARAIVQEAAILLLDEPTASLDLSHQANLFDQLVNLASNDNKSIVVVLHDLGQAAAIADRMIVLSKGKVVTDGPVSSVLTRELIWDVYNCDVHISRDLITGRLTVNPLSVSEGRRTLVGKSVYVICGGGGGGDVLRQLSSAGADVNAGYLHIGDLDYCVAQALGVTVLDIPSFDPIPEITDADILDIANRSDAIVFTPSSIGATNLAALSAALRLASVGAKLYTFSHVKPSNITRYQDEENIIQHLWNELLEKIALPPVEKFEDLILAISGVDNA